MTNLVSPRPRKRPAALLILMLASLALIGLLAVQWLRMIALEREQLKAHSRTIQADYLALSGVQRARAQLAAEAGYRGETWEIAAEALGGRGAATVAISVEPVEDQPQAHKLRAVAEYPAGAVARSRRTSEMIISLPSEGETP